MELSRPFSPRALLLWRRRFGWAGVSCLLLMGLCPPAAAQPAPGLTERAFQWPMEHVRLNNGRQFSGLIESVGDGAVEFVEIQRPQGKPMFLVVRPIERAAIAEIRRLPEEQRAILEQRIHSFKNRARVEAGRMESVPLEKIEVDGTRFYRYQGEWLGLDATTDEQLTRQLIVRLEQMLLAFRQVMPPEQKPPAGHSIQMTIFGASDQYYQYLRDKQIDIRNPAYFDAGRNMVVAGSDIDHFAAQLAAVRRRHAELQAEQAQRAAELPTRLKQLNDDLKKSDVAEKERRRILAATQASWQTEQAQLERRISQADRRNAVELDQLLDQVLRRLYHEAFHAYLENYIYARRDHDVPRWLNEGLAQIFEAGRLEADSLRIDAPLPEALARLQADLRGQNPLALADLLEAEETVFLVPHRSGGTTSARHYLYSWGLAYYLTFEMSLLESPALDAYVAASARSQPPRERFERLVNLPLEQFEQNWRKHMLAIPPIKP